MREMWRSRIFRFSSPVAKSNGSQLLVGERFPEFVPRTGFIFDNHPHWFIGHMSSARVRMEQKYKDVDVLLEVRDARAPFSSAQFEMTATLGEKGRKVPRLVVLNKADLVTPNVGLAMRQLIDDAGLPCLLTSAISMKNLIKIKEFALDNCRAKHPRTLGLMLMVVGLPNVGKSTVINGLKKLAFLTAKQQGKDSKLMFGVKRSKAKANNEPGATRHLQFFQLSHQPRLYCYDTPGVSLMKRRNDPERNTKLSLLRTMPDHFAGEMYIADYLLYRLNREQLFEYVEELELPGPTDDVRYLTSHVAALIVQRKQVSQVNVTWGAIFFLDLFRRGRLGKLCLDHIPDPDEVQRLRELRTQSEPPGPWGPPCYPEAQHGLELEPQPRRYR